MSIYLRHSRGRSHDRVFKELESKRFQYTHVKIDLRPRASRVYLTKGGLYFLKLKCRKIINDLIYLSDLRILVFRCRSGQVNGKTSGTIQRMS